MDGGGKNQDAKTGSIQTNKRKHLSTGWTKGVLPFPFLADFNASVLDFRLVL
jgi:hypothetical protein